VKDKKGVQFILTTVIGGVLFLVPVVFLGMMLSKASGFMMIIALPLADHRQHIAAAGPAVDSRPCKPGGKRFDLDGRTQTSFDAPKFKLPYLTRNRPPLREHRKS
jgi:hypothetical protein